MVARTHRFHGYNSLKFVYTKGQTVRGQFVSLKYVLNSKRTDYRVAVVVSRKVDKSAVVRNRIRRRIYEIVRTELPEELPPYDLVFSVYQPTVATMEASDLRAAIVSQLKRLVKAG